jgi:hypothetical protein
MGSSCFILTPGDVAWEDWWRITGNRKWGGSGTLDDDDEEHNNNWLGYGWQPERLYNKDDPVDKRRRQGQRRPSRGVTQHL